MEILNNVLKKLSQRSNEPIIPEDSPTKKFHFQDTSEIPQRYGNDPFTQSVIQKESSGNPNAISQDKGAVGLMQIRKPALADYNKQFGTNHKLEEMVNPELNKRVGSWYLNQKIPAYLEYYGIEITPENMLAAYNQGIGNLKNNTMDSSVEQYKKDILNDFSRRSAK